MTHVRSWLPAEAIQRGVRDVALRTCVREWASSWFAVEQADLTGDPVASPQPSKGRGASWHLADGVALALAEDADTRVAALMFGTPDDVTSLTVADRVALDTAAETCITDLRARLVSALRLGSGATWRAGAQAPDASADWWTWRVTDRRGGTLLEIALSEDLIIKRIRAALAPVAARSLSSLAAALSDQQVTVSALVGRSRLTTTELAGLSCGDVLVLDRDIDAAIEVAVEHRPKPLRCTVDSHGDRLQLTIV